MNKEKTVLAEKMIDFRAKNNMSQQQLANLIGVNRYTVWRIESGYDYKATTERKILQIINNNV